MSHKFLLDGCLPSNFSVFLLRWSVIIARVVQENIQFKAGSIGHYSQSTLIEEGANAVAMNYAL